MNQAKSLFYEPVELALTEPLPLTQHPAAVYLSASAPSSRRSMRQSLQAFASMLTNGTCDAMTLVIEFLLVAEQHRIIAHGYFYSKQSALVFRSPLPCLGKDLVYLTALNQANFRISEPLIQNALRIAGEL
jgi:hypothetical protein